MTKFDKFLYGFIPGLFLPVLFMWVYLARFYPGDLSFFEILKDLYPSPLFGKILMLSSIPNMVFVFVFYKSDSFKIATGVLLSGMIFFIASIFMQ
ncbi:MAG: hypothetical protein PHS59_05695 [Paludibacter sp.]|nr:hypothetical protein [Paludibacter sp.]